METPSYLFAQLHGEEIEQIRQLEQQLSESSGHEVTLIAYEPATDPTDTHRDKS